MKDFDYDKAYAGAAVCTRDGNPARIICWDADVRFDGDTYPIIALVSRYKDRVADETTVSYTEDGKEVVGKDSKLDLMMAGIKREGWVNIYGKKGLNSCGGLYQSIEHAKKDGELCEEYITTIHIEWEE